MLFLSSHSPEMQVQVAPWCRDCPGLARDNMPPAAASVLPRVALLFWSGAPSILAGSVCPGHLVCVRHVCLCKFDRSNQNGVFFPGSKPLGVASLESWMDQSALLGTGNIDTKWDLMSSSTGRGKYMDTLPGVFFPRPPCVAREKNPPLHVVQPLYLSES